MQNCDGITTKTCITMNFLLSETGKRNDAFLTSGAQSFGADGPCVQVG